MLMAISRWQSCHFLRLVVSGALLAGLSACESGNPADQSFTLPSDSLPTNVVSNSGLESSGSDLSGWSAYASDDSTAEAIFTVDGDAYHGNNAFKASIVALGENAYDIEGGPVNVPVIAGGTYALVAWAKGTEGAQANFTASLAEAPWTTFAEKLVIFEGAWQQVAFNFTLPEDLTATTIRLPIQMNFDGNEGVDIYVDDLQLLPIEPVNSAPVDVVVNGSLEDSDIGYDGWSGGAAEGTLLSVDTNEAYYGNNSFKVAFGSIADGANAWDVEAGPVNVPVTEGETYTFSAWVKGTEGAKAIFNVQLAESPYHAYGSQEVDVTGEWQQVTFDVLIAESSTIEGWSGPTTSVRLFAQMGFAENSGAEIYIDYVRLLTSEAEIVVNGDLEASDISYDNWGGNAPEGTELSVTALEQFEGNNSFHVSFGDIGEGVNPWEVEAGPVNVPVTESVDYTFSAWVKGSVGAKATFNVQLEGAPYHAYANQTVDITGEWQQVTFDALIAEASTIEGYEGPTTEIRLYVQMGYTENAGADIYIDKVSLIAK